MLLLVENAGKVVSKEEFKSKVWNGKFIEDRILAVNISGLRKILGTEKDGTNFIQNISGRGYRFVVEVEHMVSNDEKFSQNNQENEKSTQIINISKISDIPDIPNPLRKLLKPKILIIGLLLAIIGIGAVFYFSNNKKSEIRAAEIKKIVIFPFENLSQIQEADFLSLAFADSLNYSLFPFPNISVISTTQIKQYFNKSYDPVEEGKKLGVNAVVTGSYHKSADKLVVNVVVTDITSQNPIIQQEQFIKTTNDLTDLQGNVVRFMISRLNLNVSEKDLAALKKRETQNLNAYELYLRASNFYANDKLEDAINYYQQSLNADPDFEIASEGLAAVFMTQGNAYGCGEPCSNKALEILYKLQEKDPDNYRVSINLAQTYVELNQTEKAVPILKEILAKDPKNYFAYNGLSYAYRYGGLLDESNLMYQKGKEDDSYTVLTEKGYWFYNNARLYQGEYTGFITSLKDDDDTFISMFYQGLGYFYLKDNEKAKSLFAEAYQKEPDAMITQLGKVYIYYIDNDKAKGLEMLDKIYQNIKVRKVYDGEMIYKTAQAFAVFDQKEKALGLFALSVEKGFFCYPYFASDSLLKNIRNESNFQIVLEKARIRFEKLTNQVKQT